jgi:hypothetical protein
MKKKISFGQKPVNRRPAQNEITIDTAIHTSMTAQIMMSAINYPFLKAALVGGLYHVKPAMSLHGTNPTCRGSLTMSVDRGKPEGASPQSK